MASDITITEVPQVDTLKYLDTELADDKSSPIINKEDNDKEEDDEKSLKLSDTEDDVVDNDEIDFRPSLTKKDLTAAFPEIFKKFPQLERAIYRERQFSELFPTIQNAKEVIERASTLESAESSLFRGEISDILDSVRSNDKEAFLRIVDNFLPTIDKLDRGTYLTLLGNIGKGFIKNIAAESQRFGRDTDQGKQLNLAATVLHQFLFGNSEWKEPVNLSKPLSADDKKINDREQEIIQQRFLEVQEDLNDRATNAVKSTIIQYIDPKESMSEFVKEKAIDECGAKLQSLISEDKNFLNKMDSLWKIAIDSNFNKSSLEKIKSTYFAKAQVLLPDIIKLVRAKALSGMGKSSPKRTVTEREENPRVEKEKENGRSTSNKSRQNDDQPRSRESTRDFLNRTLGE